MSVSCSVYCVSCTQVGGGREGTGAENKSNEGERGDESSGPTLPLYPSQSAHA